MAAKFIAAPSPIFSTHYLIGYLGRTSRWAYSSSSSHARPDKLADRLSSVIDAVNDRKLPPELRGQRNAVRSETDIINVVEQRIWHSMEEGQFENLPGKGKPLNLDINPHADPAEDTLYKILSRNKCAPEWVELNKEIRSNITEWRLSLKKAEANRLDGNYSKWIEASEALKQHIHVINDKTLVTSASPFLLKLLIILNKMLILNNNSKKKVTVLAAVATLTEDHGSGGGGVSLGTQRMTEKRKSGKTDELKCFCYKMSLYLLQVFRYNLIVPFGRQMFGLKWEKELDRLKE
ncbi:hypothetical protein IFM89_034367 [Coptis chinensis]|uniref:DnaJ homologue subfamily C member 28 conserved domain-containing protein n=1 Tax=Coptis chinensis TaxID=261450 RepID=A0A835LK92_9MAGN|nr:hypothetical protein IFM89_034367 [Coptis chinensis]